MTISCGTCATEGRENPWGKPPAESFSLRQCVSRLMDHSGSNCHELTVCKMDTYFCLCFLCKTRNQSSIMNQLRIALLMQNGIRLINCISIHLCYSSRPQKCHLVLRGKGDTSIISPPPAVKVAAGMTAYCYVILALLHDTQK